MALLQQAKIEQSAAKVGIFGRQGCGKTTTAALIAIGLSKTYHQAAPVAWLDTENGSDPLVPIFEAEGVPLLVSKSRAFADMRAVLTEAERRGCCAYLVDSYTHPWQELMATFKEKSQRKKLEFHHMDALKTLWRGWTDQFLNSPLHVILSGRLGFEWGEEQTDEGRTLVKLGTKMKSEYEAGYEPSLLLEMEGLQEADVRLRASRAKKGTIVHHVYVLKDRWRTLNGRTFQFKDINTYKVGDYRKVFEAFGPHWSKLVIGGPQKAVDGSRTSGALFAESTGESVGQERARRAQIAAEEIAGILQHLWGGQTAGEKKIRQSLLHELFGTFSWHAIETARLEHLDRAVELLREFQNAAEAELPDDPEAAVKLLTAIQRELYGDPAPGEDEADAEPARIGDET
jgi:hypothetical protein